MAALAYPTIEQIFNLARVYIDDAYAGSTGTLGEGRNFTDSFTPNLTILNEAITDFIRDMENANVPILHKEANVLNLPVVHGVNGSGIADPAVLCYLGFSGFWDGTTLNATPTLPTDLVVPITVMQRASGATNVFGAFVPVPGPIASANQTTGTLGNWEWRGDAIYMNGSTGSMDVRIVYRSYPTFWPLTTTPANFPTTSVPLMDCLEPLAFRTGYIFAQSKVQQGAAQELLQNYDHSVAKIAQRYAFGKWWNAPTIGTPAPIVPATPQPQGGQR